MKPIISIILFSFIASVSIAQDNNNISLTLRSGNAKELSKYFVENIELAIIEKEGVYSKSQAQIILNDFFTKYIPNSFNILHQGKVNDKEKYFIGSLVTDKKKFRVYYYLIKKGDKYLIRELSFKFDEGK